MSVSRAINLYKSCSTANGVPLLDLCLILHSAESTHKKGIVLFVVSSNIAVTCHCEDCMTSRLARFFYVSQEYDVVNMLSITINRRNSRNAMHGESHSRLCSALAYKWPLYRNLEIITILIVC